MPRPFLYMPKTDSGWALFELTVRCIHSRFLLRPGKAENEQYIGCLVKALEMANKDGDTIRFHLGGGLSNHFHLLVSAKSANALARFKSHFFGNLSKEIGRLHKWPQHLFSRRCRTILVADDAIEDRAMYLIVHGYKEGLTRRGCWPGVPWIEAVTEGKVLTGIWIDRTGFYTEKRAKKRRKSKDDKKVRIKDFYRSKTLILHPLPGWEDFTEQERRTHWLVLIEKAHRKHAPNGPEPLGVRKVLATRPHDKPKKTKCSPAPMIHTKDKAVRKAWRRDYKAFVESYRAGLSAMVEGVRDEACFVQGVTPMGMLQRE